MLGISDRAVRAYDRRLCAEHGWAVHTHLAEVREELTEPLASEHGCSRPSSTRAGSDCSSTKVIAGHCIWCCGEATLACWQAVTVGGRPQPGCKDHPLPRVSARFRGSGGRVFASRGSAPTVPPRTTTRTCSARSSQRRFCRKFTTLDPVVIDCLPKSMRYGDVSGGVRKRCGMQDPGIGSPSLGQAGRRPQLLDGNGPELAVLHDPFQQVVYGATPRSVSDVWVDGVQRVSSGSRAAGVDRGRARRRGTRIRSRSGPSW